jgi:hypothetical protein
VLLGLLGVAAGAGVLEEVSDFGFAASVDFFADFAPDSDRESVR